MRRCGPHRSPQKPVQINIDYDIISLIKRRKYPLFSLWKLKGYCSSFDQTWIPFTQGCFVPSLIEIVPVILEKKIFKFRQFILLFRSHLPLKKGIALHLNKHEYSSPKDALYQISWIWPSEFLNFINVFSQFRNNPPLEKGLHLN